MGELEKYQNILKKYNKNPNSGDYQKLILFVCKKEEEIMRGREIDRPHDGDKFQPFRLLLKEIRNDLKLLHRSEHQYPPIDLKEKLERLKEEKLKEEEDKLKKIKNIEKS